MHNTGSLASTRAPLVAVCRSVSRELKHHDRERQKSKKENKYVRPYYRPSVFHYQLCWIDYFIREAKAMVPVLLTESEMLDKKAKMPDVPPELQFEALPRSVPPYVVTLWREWNEKKRAGTPASGLAVPEVQNGAPGGLRGGGVMSPIAETKTDNENKDGDLSLSQDTTPVATPTPTPGGSSESDAHFWSEGGHD